jgi:hypothetical protein
VTVLVVSPPGAVEIIVCENEVSIILRASTVSLLAARPIEQDSASSPKWSRKRGLKLLDQANKKQLGIEHSP